MRYDMRRSRVMRFLAGCAVLGALALSGSLAFADEAEECDANCAAQHKACVAKAKEFVNDIEVQDATAACDAAVSACRQACMVQEQNRPRFQPPPTEQ